MDKLNDLLADLLGLEPEAIDEAAPFAELEGWDSLKYMRLVLGVESGFSVELAPEEIQRLTSVAAVKDVLRARGVESL
jgi:acyl carrier protein